MIRVKRYKKLLGVIIIVLIVILLIIVIEIRGRERTAQQQQQQIAAPLTVASQFMGDPNITKCQTGTSLHLGRYVGNTIPTEIGPLTQLTTLFLNGTIGNLIQHLRELVTSLCSKIHILVGTIPSSLCSLTG